MYEKIKNFFTAFSSNSKPKEPITQESFLKMAEEIEKAEQQFLQIKSEKNDLETKFSALNQEKNAMQQELLVAKSEKDELLKKVASLEAENQKLKEKPLTNGGIKVGEPEKEEIEAGFNPENAFVTNYYKQKAAIIRGEEIED